MRTGGRPGGREGRTAQGLAIGQCAAGERRACGRRAQGKGVGGVAEAGDVAVGLGLVAGSQGDRTRQDRQRSGGSVSAACSNGIGRGVIDAGDWVATVAVDLCGEIVQATQVDRIGADVGARSLSIAAVSG